METPVATDAENEVQVAAASDDGRTWDEAGWRRLAETRPAEAARLARELAEAAIRARGVADELQRRCRFVERLALDVPKFGELSQPALYADHPRCQADRDGDCVWTKCPQARDGEPKRTGRHCPIDDGREWE